MDARWFAVGLGPAARVAPALACGMATIVCYLIKLLSEVVKKVHAKPDQKQNGLDCMCMDVSQTIHKLSKDTHGQSVDNPLIPLDDPEGGEEGGGG